MVSKAEYAELLAEIELMKQDIVSLKEATGTWTALRYVGLRVVITCTICRVTRISSIHNSSGNIRNRRFDCFHQVHG